MFRHVTEVTLGSFAFPLWGGVLAADRRAPPVELRARAEAHAAGCSRRPHCRRVVPAGLVPELSLQPAALAKGQSDTPVERVA